MSGKTNIEVSTYIIPDKGIFRCELAMIHTSYLFDNLVRSKIEKSEDKKIGKKLYDLMCRYLQGKSLKKW